MGIFADGDEDLPSRSLDPLGVAHLLDGLPAEPAVHQPGGQVVQVVRFGGRAAVPAGQRVPSDPPESASTPSASACALRLSFSAAVSTGGWSDGWRLPKPL